LIEINNPNLNLSRQAKLLNISRSSVYYEPVISREDIETMNGIDKIYTACPFYGHRKVREELKYEYNINIGKKKTLSLMKKMGLEAIYPKKKINTSNPNKQHLKFPYLLKNIEITHPNQVWGTDITYIRLKKNFIYLTVILDWFSRYVISWRLSDGLQTEFCIDSLREALNTNIPNIHNSDQGSQFTSQNYTDILEERNVSISMDGRGRCMDNIFTERLWRTVKQENIYLNDYTDISEAKLGLSEYFSFYNKKRRHQSLNYKTPEEIYTFK